MKILVAYDYEAQEFLVDGRLSNFETVEELLKKPDLAKTHDVNSSALCMFSDIKRQRAINAGIKAIEAATAQLEKLTPVIGPAKHAVDELAKGLTALQPYFIEDT